MPDPRRVRVTSAPGKVTIHYGALAVPLSPGQAETLALQLRSAAAFQKGRK